MLLVCAGWVGGFSVLPNTLLEPVVDVANGLGFVNKDMIVERSGGRVELREACPM